MEFAGAPTLVAFVLATLVHAVTPVLFGATFVLIAAATDVVYVLAAGAVASPLRSLERGRAMPRHAAACALIGLGIFAATSGSRATK